MLVKDCMTRHPIMIHPTTPAVEAQKVMSENKVRHLPVVGDGKRLQGLITRQCLRLEADTLGSLNMWEITRYLANVTAQKVMVPANKVHTINPDRTVERAARQMSEHKIGCLPVLEDKVVIGIISEIDLLRAFQEMLGLPVDGVRVTVRMPHRKGEFGKLMTALGKASLGVMGIGTFPTARKEGFYDAVIKIPNVSIDEVKEALSYLDGQEVVDIRDAV